MTTDPFTDAARRRGEAMIRAACHTCREATEERNTGMGRARIAAFLTHHQGHDAERYYR